MAELDSIDITGDGRLRCVRCNEIWPAFYPSCPDCLGTVFFTLAIEPEPPIVYPQEFLAERLDSTTAEVQDLLAEARATDLIHSLARKGCFLHADRTVGTFLRSSFRLSLSRANYELAILALEDSIYYELVPGVGFSRSFRLGRGAVPHPVPDTIVIGVGRWPDDIEPVALVEDGVHEDLPALTASGLFDPDRMPHPDALVYCPVCHIGNYDPGNLVENVEGAIIAGVGVDRGAVAGVGGGGIAGVGDGVGGGGVAATYESFRVLLPCQHMFHPECVNDWFTRSLTCPTCRRVVVTDDEDFNTWATMLNAGIH